MCMMFSWSPWCLLYFHFFLFIMPQQMMSLSWVYLSIPRGECMDACLKELLLTLSYKIMTHV